MTPTTVENNKAKRAERRKQTAEDFTPAWLVKKILDKLGEYSDDVWKDPRKTMIDPACGNGNFLVEIVKRKLQSGHKEVDVARTVFGLDIMQDNIQEARYRVCRVFDIFGVLNEDVIITVWQNIRCVNDTLSVDFDKAIFKTKKAEKAKLTAIVRKVQGMNKDQKKIEVRRRFLKGYFYNNEHIQAIQNVHTPFNLAKSMVKKLEGFTALTDEKSYICFNPEFVEALIGEGIDAENIWFISECGEKVSFVENVYKGVHGIHDDFVSWTHGDTFDVVIGNPPYQASKMKESTGRGKCGKSIWENFVQKSFDICKEKGFVSLIHPSRWRKPNNKIGKFIMSKKIHYLEIHDLDDGMKTFGCQTRYDWYVAENTDKYGDIVIKDEDGEEVRKNMNEILFIPNGMIDDIMSLIAKDGEETVDVLYSRSAYGSDKKWMNKEKSEEFKHPCVYSINSKGKVKYLYSSKKDIHFGVPKVIFPCGAFQSVDVLIDDEGKYGLTQFARGIVDDPKNLGNIKKALRSEKFINMYFKFTMGSTELDKDVISLFRKDFWKDFI